MKSHVGMGFYICPATGNKLESTEILLDKRLKASLEPENFMGWKLSPEVQEQIDNGFVCLIVIDEEKSTGHKPHEVWRTGDVVYMKLEAAQQAYGDEVKDLAFISEASFEDIKKLNDELNKKEE